MGELSRDLQALYEQVPATRCAGSGDCCALTEAEFANDYATMFPLYRAEYLHIEAYVQEHFAPPRRDELLSFTEERPHRCPFLGERGQCTIYPVRPLICRTYGVMNPVSIAREAARQRGRAPEQWIRAFALRESGMVCPRVALTEPEKLARHARNLIDFTYERELNRLSRVCELAGEERLRLYAQVSGRENWPLTWTWGGFNAVRRQSLRWLRRNFGTYWKKARLADVG